MATLLFLPITPGDAWKPIDGHNPTQRILLLLLANVGLPYLLSSATAPLLQSCFARVYPGRSPYRLYALSNAGSLTALLSYPFVVEPLLATGEAAGGLAVAVLCPWMFTFFVETEVTLVIGFLLAPDSDRLTCSRNRSASKSLSRIKRGLSPDLEGLSVSANSVRNRAVRIPVGLTIATACREIAELRHLPNSPLRRNRVAKYVLTGTLVSQSGWIISCDSCERLLARVIS